MADKTQLFTRYWTKLKHNIAAKESAMYWSVVLGPNKAGMIQLQLAKE